MSEEPAAVFKFLDVRLLRTLAAIEDLPLDFFNFTAHLSFSKEHRLALSYPLARFLFSFCRRFLAECRPCRCLRVLRGSIIQERFRGRLRGLRRSLYQPLQGSFRIAVVALNLLKRFMFRIRSKEIDHNIDSCRPVSSRFARLMLAWSTNGMANLRSHEKP